MNPVALIIGVVVVALFLLVINNFTGLFIDAQQVQLAYIGITILAASIVIGAFKGA